MRIDASDLREIKLFKYYRLVRKWACKTNGLTDGDLELLIYLDCLDRFTLKDFKNGEYIYSWDKHRWNRLRKEGWIDAWRNKSKQTGGYSIFKVSFKTRSLITRMYKILLGYEDLPTSKVSVFYKNKSYTDKVFNKATDDMIKDKDR
jgi:hypothetical protein